MNYNKDMIELNSILSELYGKIKNGSNLKKAIQNL